MSEEAADANVSGTSREAPAHPHLTPETHTAASLTGGSDPRP